MVELIPLMRELIPPMRGSMRLSFQKRSELKDESRIPVCRQGRNPENPAIRDKKQQTKSHNFRFYIGKIHGVTSCMKFYSSLSPSRSAATCLATGEFTSPQAGKNKPSNQAPPLTLQNWGAPPTVIRKVWNSTLLNYQSYGAKNDNARKRN